MFSSKISKFLMFRVSFVRRVINKIADKETPPNHSA